MLTIIARPTVDPERLAEVTEAMLDLVAATHKEDGCIRYELHQDNTQPNRFVFVESWQDRDLWRRHMEGPAVRQFNERIAGAITGFELQELTKIGG